MQIEPDGIQHNASISGERFHAEVRRVDSDEVYLDVNDQDVVLEPHGEDTHVAVVMDREASRRVYEQLKEVHE